MSLCMLLCLCPVRSETSLVRSRPTIMSVCCCRYARSCPGYRRKAAALMKLVQLEPILVMKAALMNKASESLYSSMVSWQTHSIELTSPTVLTVNRRRILAFLNPPNTEVHAAVSVLLIPSYLHPIHHELP
ncbi:hypothetical protein B9Z19DRAFT_481972 [Tuber borchii]|uniref:Secreted protein n=1 Tax=Tuber borchii TaxID=42251 RepID=A0A2T6ZF85_TUBBO|nr:hypothetical protein B9Z19DRAFT_481972 [Tuber borchii]